MSDRITTLRAEQDHPVRRHRAVFDDLPRRTPDALIPDGPLLGNGDVGVVVDAELGPGAAATLLFRIAKSDFWRAERGYPRGGPRPFGVLELEIGGLAGASFRAEQNLYDARTSVWLDTPDERVEVRAWVAADRNVLVVEVDAGDRPSAARLVPAVGDGATIESGRSEDLTWALRAFRGAELDWPCTMAAAVAEQRQPDGAVRFVIGMATSFEGDPVELACQQTRAAAADPRMVAEGHDTWWRDFWSRSSIDIGDELLERYYYGAQYLLASCSRNRRFPPGLFGNWVTTDEPEWAGDYHLNYNYQAAWWGAFASNHVELTEPYDAPVLAYQDRAASYARDVFGCAGLAYDVGIGPDGFCSSWEVADDRPAFMGQRSNAAFAAVNMILRWWHTRDTGYARRVLPFLLGVAEFWSGSLRPDGDRLVVTDDSLNETGTWNGPDWRELTDTNNTLSLGLIRNLLTGLLDIAGALGPDAVDRERWARLLDRLSDYPTARIDGVRRLLGAETGLGAGVAGPGNKRLLLQGTVFPTGVVGPRNRPDLAAALLADLEELGESEWIDAFNGFDTVFPGAARLGFDAETLLGLLRAKIVRHGYPNLWIHQGGGGVETFSGIEAGLNELLLQSYEGVIRLFPNWPAGRPAAFRRLRAYGAFLVTAARTDEGVVDASLFSELGGPARVVNPWPAATVQVRRDGQPAEIVDGPMLTIDTTAGEHVELNPIRQQEMR